MKNSDLEKIKELARNLKRLHLAASMEEAVAKAKEVLLDTAAEDKSVKDMIKEISLMGELKKDFKEAKDAFEKDKQLHSAEEKGIGALVKESNESIVKSFHAIDDVKELEELTKKVKKNARK